MLPHQFGVVDNDTVLYVSNSYVMKVMFDRDHTVEFPIIPSESVRILQCSQGFVLLSLDGILYTLDHNTTQTIRTNAYSMGLPVFVAQNMDGRLVRLSQPNTHGHIWNPSTGQLDLVDLASMRHTDPASAPVLSGVQGLFEYVRVSNGNIYGLCRLLDGTYVVIKVINETVMRIINHCGPIDICPFESTGAFLATYKNLPVVRNSERVFVLESTLGTSASSRTFPTDGLSVFITGTTHDKLVFCKRGVWTYLSTTGPKRGNLVSGAVILAITDTRVVVRVAQSGVQERAFSSVFDESSSGPAEECSRTRPLRHFVVTTCVKGSVNVARVIENIRTRSSETHIVEIHPHTCVVSTGVRFDSFQTSLRNAFATSGGGMVMYHDYVLTEFPSAELAEMFSRRLWS